MINISTTQFENLINNIDISIFSIIIKLIIIYFLLCILKSIVENLAAYFLFKSDPLVSIGKKVEVDNFIGIITKITLGYITIENEYNDICVIRIANWKSKNWIFLNQTGDLL